MAAKNADNVSVEAEKTVKEATVPHQNDAPKLEVVDDIVVDGRNLVEKTKDVLSNKKFIAGVTSVVAIAVGVFVVNKKRNESGSETAPEAEVAEG